MTVERLTYPHRRRGLDHDWFVHEPTFKRAPLVWPEGKRIALWITVPVEVFPLDAPALASPSAGWARPRLSGFLELQQ